MPSSKTAFDIGMFEFEVHTHTYTDTHMHSEALHT